ncbi:MAG TPA: AMP-binding protein [Spirochaetota bacterium]|nr:AMP-binding protein [Spirochaetota bacterium]HPH03044.1 AMP-binding protein [Spirochaetota bacterium]HPN82212.1 AMP-binding protein [Spirochaetota bacterium]
MFLERFVNRTEFSSYDDFFHNFRIHTPDQFNFAYDVVDAIAAETPNKRAMVWVNDHGEKRVFSFADLKRYSDRAANVLRTHGIGKGDAVMMTLKGRYEFWFCILAIHKLGAIAIPATHMLTEHDLVYRIESADVKMIISVNEQPLVDAIDAAAAHGHPSLTKRLLLGADRPGWVNYDAEMEIAQEVFDRPTGEAAAKTSDIMLLYFTSGTVGYPKMVNHDFAYPLGHIITAKYWQNVQEDGLHYTVADTGWAKAVWGKIYGQWLAGTAIFVHDYDKFDALTLLERASENGVTTFCAPPTIYRFLIKQDLSKFDLSSLKYCVTAGEPLNPEVYEQFYKATGLRLMEGFGQTEMVVLLATFPWMTPKPGSMGRPSPGYRVVLLNPEGKPCEVGEEGEVAIDLSQGKPWGLFNGYYRDEQRTASVWHDGYYYTGDIAWRDEDGYFWFVGRADDVIKTSGYRVGPFEVESALITHKAVMECAITGVPDPDRGQVIKATVVLAKGFEPSENLKRELQEHVKKVTAPYKYPRIVEFVEALPKTISGKIRRVQIRAEDSNKD